MNRRLFWIVLLALAGALPLRAEEPVRVFAAASLTDALQQAARAWQARGHPAPVLAFGGSAVLAKQIDAGAPADVFASADLAWMAYLRERGRLADDAVAPLLGNTLVLVAPKGRAPAVTLSPGFDFAASFAGKLCTGEPGAVPAGTYARQALEHFGWWHAVAPRVVGADDVRTALSFVERGECALGIVYASDARASDAVVVVAQFPPDSHAAIAYPFARVQGARAPAREFLDWLRSAPEARAAFEAHGFAWRAR